MYNKKTLWILFVLAVTQLIGWGTISLPAVIGDRFAQDLSLSLPTVFAGSTTMLVVTGITALLLTNAFVVYGARLVMAAGTVIAATGFVLLAVATGPIVYFLAWVIIGISGAATLSTASYVFLNELAGSAAKRLISTLLLVTGLASSIFWPITAALSGAWGWRPTMLIYAGLMVFVCLPLYIFGLPARHLLENGRAASPAAAAPAIVRGKIVFLLLASAVTIHGFVSWGFSSIVIQLLRNMGTPDARAVQLGSLLGVMQVCARGLDFVGGRRWDGLTTGLIAATALPISFLVLIVGAPASYAIFGFLTLYGMANGLMTVANATMPLVFYDQADYARASSRIAFPRNVVAAAAPPILVSILTQSGSDAVLTIGLVCTLVSLALLIALRIIHRKAVAIQQLPSEA
jgi:predicted MFS family arabinose efflux permease